MASIDWFVDRGLDLLALRQQRETCRLLEKSAWDKFRALSDQMDCGLGAYADAKYHFDRGLELDDQIHALKWRIQSASLDPPSWCERIYRWRNKW